MSSCHQFVLFWFITRIFYIILNHPQHYQLMLVIYIYTSETSWKKHKRIDLIVHYYDGDHINIYIYI